MTPEKDSLQKKKPIWILAWTMVCVAIAIPSGVSFGAGIGSLWVAVANVSSFEGGSGYAVIAIVMVVLPFVLIASLIGGLVESRFRVPKITILFNLAVGILGIFGMIAGEYL